MAALKSVALPVTVDVTTDVWVPSIMVDVRTVTLVAVELPLSVPLARVWLSTSVLLATVELSIAVPLVASVWRTPRMSDFFCAHLS